MVITSDNEGKDVCLIFSFIKYVSVYKLICFKIDDDEVTRPTFAERKRLGKYLFDSDSNSSEPSIHSSSEEDSNNEGSSDEFIWKNKLKKLCKSMTMDDFDRVR